MRKEPIRVTSPLLPPLSELTTCMEDIWEQRQITNYGMYHDKLESALSAYLSVPYLSLFTNGTLALLCALRALDIRGEVITTPYSFVATAHVLLWSGIRPVFVDIDPRTCNLDVNKIEAAITPRTTAILPVHVYGTPCDTEQIQKIADRYHLKVIYDAAHAFGVQREGKSVMHAGDISMVSFHATKVYNTIEGGALICRDAETKQRVEYLKNFGFEDETSVPSLGINAKMDEVRAAYGYLNLRQVEEAIEARKRITLRYREGLINVSGISFLEEMPGVQSNYAYFPLFIDPAHYGKTRDALYEQMKVADIYGRRYFYPLISSFPMYKELESSDPLHLPVAHQMATSVLCLPLYPGLSDEDTDRVLCQLV